MASSVSEQEGVEAMLGLGLVAGAGGPADDAGEGGDDVAMIPGVMTIKGTQEDIVRRARACTESVARLSIDGTCSKKTLSKRERTNHLI